jgi:Na+/H+-translocating membrane pyrophosphatase
MLLGVTLALGVIVGATQAATAGGALIETSAPLSDRSEEAVKTAFVAAIDQAVRGATAMGFAWVQLRGAQVSEDEVVIQILATAEEPDEVTPSPEAEESDGDVTDEQPPGPAPSGRIPI